MAATNGDYTWQSAYAKMLADQRANQNPYTDSTNYADAAHQGGGSSAQLINGQWYNVSNRTGYKTAIAGVRVQPINGANYYVAGDGTVLGLYTAPKGTGLNLPNLTGAGSGPTWYEQQQIALDKQRIKDAERAQAAQEAYQKQQQLIAQSNAVEAANQSYRDLQLKSYGATANGMAFASAKGAPVTEMLPEPLLLKQAYAANHQPDPWNAPAAYGGYGGTAYQNASQPGLVNQGEVNYPTSGPGSIITPPPSSLPWGSSSGGRDINPGPPVAPHADIAGADNTQFMQWHDLAHQIPAGGPAGGPSGIASQMPVPSMASGGTVPGYTGQPQLVMAHGGEHITPVPGTPQVTLMGSPGGAPFSNPLGVPGYAMGGTVGADNGATDPFTLFNAWHDAIHAAPPSGEIGWGGGGPWSHPMGRPGPLPWSGGPVVPPTQNAYGQNTPDNVVHSPGYNDILGGKATLNPNPERYDPVLTGMSGFGATITADGTPVVMSNWQRAHLPPSVVSGPRGYDDYAQQVAGWSSQDLAALGTSMTGNFGTDLTAPKNYAPISVNPAPAGG